MKKLPLPPVLTTLALCLPLWGLWASCGPRQVGHASDEVGPSPPAESLTPGDERTDVYLPLLRDKRVAVFSNHTGMVGGRHLLDLLLAEGIRVTAIFSPEHGFRGTADAGEHVTSEVDPPTGIPILSLYNGRDQRPSPESMDRLDVLVVDIQDVGLRFYTYYITLCRLMDACAEHGKEVVLLDRPNPNGHYVDGPVLDGKHRSGVGLIPIPIVHGMTLGELALMVNGEGWLAGGRRCELTVVPCLGYTHATPYDLPIAPSPNLPTMKAVLLYPSTCLFEGTVMSLGRGTDLPFQVYGHPDLKGCDYAFTPVGRPGAKHPPHEGRACYGVDLSCLADDDIRREGRINLSYLIDAYRRMNLGDGFFTPFFEKLVGVDYVRRMIEDGCTESEIRARWSDDVEAFKQLRAQYLLYE